MTFSKALSEMDPTEDPVERQLNLNLAIQAASTQLNNTPQIARDNYIPKELQDVYIASDGFHKYFSRIRKSEEEPDSDLSTAERDTLNLLRHKIPKKNFE